MIKNSKDIFELIKENEFEHIKTLLNEDPKNIDVIDMNGATPPFIAAECGYFDLLKFIIEYSFASMNVWDNSHHTILHYAARSNNLDCFKYLVERVSIDPMDVNIQRETPLDIAIKSNSTSIINYYRDVLNIESKNIYKNPILPGANPDPSIVRVDDNYYMVTSSFVFFPAIPIYHSKDLVNWKTIGHGIIDSTYIDLSVMDDGRGFWAPDISYNKGKFYITATLRCNDSEVVKRKQMVVHSSRPEGPYSEPTYIEEDGIDPSIFTDDDGKRYMLLNRGARIFEISESGDKKLSQGRLLWYGAQKRAPEAPHLLKKDGYYYIFVAEGGTGPNHQISVARSKELFGIYESCPYNPILKQNDPLHPIQRSGHGKMVSTQDGEWFITYLSSRMVEQKYSVLGRETSLDRVIWTDDGWPMVNYNKGPSGASLKPKIEEGLDRTHSISTYNGLDPEYVFIRKPWDNFYNYNGELDALSIVGGKWDLSSKECRNLIVKRQSSLQSIVTVDIEFSLENSDSEAGLTCFYDNSAYFKFFISKNEGDHYLNLIERIGENSKTTSSRINFNGNIELKIVNNLLVRTLYYRNRDSKGWILFKKIENTYYLSDEGVPGKKFTGTMVGVYCIDYLGRDNIEAKFKHFKMENV